MPRFFVPARDIAGGEARLQGNEFRHLQRVLRLREGDHVTLFDDAGQEHTGVITSLSPRVAAVRISATTTPARESPLAIALYQGVPKGPKMDLVVEKATELGACEITAFTSAFSTVAAPVAAGRRERWQRIALAAAKQCGRTVVPAVGPTLTFVEVLAQGGSADLRLLFFEGPGRRALAALDATPITPVRAAIVIGPEGGFSRDEADAARAAGFALVGLGPRILRTETAALVALTLVQARWGDLGG